MKCFITRCDTRCDSIITISNSSSPSSLHILALVGEGGRTGSFRVRYGWFIEVEGGTSLLLRSFFHWDARVACNCFLFEVFQLHNLMSILFKRSASIFHKNSIHFHLVNSLLVTTHKRITRPITTSTVILISVWLLERKNN